MKNLGIQYLLAYSHICQTQSSDSYETVTLLYQRLYLSIQSMLKTILLDILVPGPGNITKKCSNLRIWKLLWQQCPDSLLMVYFCWKGTKTESDTIRLCENNQTLSLNLLTLSQMLILLPRGIGLRKSDNLSEPLKDFPFVSMSGKPLNRALKKNFFLMLPENPTFVKLFAIMIFVKGTTPKIKSRFWR